VTCRRLIALVCALVAPLAWAIDIPAGEAPVVLDVTTTTIGAWHWSNLNSTSCDDNYGEGLERLTATATRGPWTLGVRLDGSLYGPVPQVRLATATTPGCNQVDLRSRFLPTVIPERIWGSYADRTFEVTLGDGYVSFGRGLALSLRKNDELSTDTALRGARLGLRTDRVSAHLVGGVTNIGNIDEASGRFTADPMDVVLGAQTDVKVVEGMRVGAHAVGYAFHTPLSTPPMGGDTAWKERWLNSGFTFDAPRLTPWLGLYVEGLWQRRWPITGETKNGFGAYGAATLSLGAVTLLVEGKAYGDLAVLHPRFDFIEFQPVQYSAPPTLERVLQPLEHGQRNIYGGRVRADWRVDATLGLFAAHGLFEDAEGYLDPNSLALLPGTIHDPTAGLDWTIGGFRILGEAGWRFVYLPGNGEAVRSDGHFEVTVQKQLGTSSRSLELHVTDWERVKVMPLAAERWREGSAQFGFRWRPVQAYAGLDFSTEPGQPQTWYPNGTLQWDITRSTNLRLMVGSTRGGLRCVSGVCRVFPPFSGAKLAFTARF
jgi:hypothetical protein